MRGELEYRWACGNCSRKEGGPSGADHVYLLTQEEQTEMHGKVSGPVAGDLHLFF